LKAAGKCNSLLKFPDDYTLLVVLAVADTDVSAEDELGLSNICAWSGVDKLALNLLKTKEIVFHHPHPSKYCLPPPLLGIERVSSVKLLGVHDLTENLSMHEHVRQTIFVCNQRLYLFCQLKRQGLPLNCLNLVFDSLIIARCT